MRPDCAGKPWYAPGMMSVLLAACLIAAGASCVEAVPEACTCLSARESHGWCDTHDVGYVASIEIRSRLLYETLDAHGHQLDLGTFECASCRSAIATSGFCAEHRVGFVNGLAYFSRLTYELARGERCDAATISCAVCRKHAEGSGWCEEHRLGMIGRVAIRDRAAFEHAAAALEVLQAANREAARCEHCAMAIVTDGWCPLCRISYKNGKPLPRPAGP